MSNKFYPSYKNRCITKSGQEVLFIGYVAGGTEEEVTQGFCLCELEDGSRRRFHLEDLKWRNDKWLKL